jgi:hypothetical protein
VKPDAIDAILDSRINEPNADPVSLIYEIPGIIAYAIIAISPFFDVSICTQVL